MLLSIQELKTLLPLDQIIINPDKLLRYGKDWLNQWDQARTSLVIFPKSTKDLVNIVTWARKHKCALIPEGGRTGLSGATVALNNEAIVSFEKWNSIIEFNPVNQSLKVSAGCITKDLQNFAKKQGLYFPISFAAEASSHIGGNIATNVGGVHVIRYGSIRRYVLDLELVTGTGACLQLGKGLIKQATGYDLKNIFIGSEGTLAFISTATIQLVLPPKNPQVILMSVETTSKLMDLFKEFKSQIPILAFEFWTDVAMDYVQAHSDLHKPEIQKSKFYVLMEIENQDRQACLNLFEIALKNHLIVDAVLSQNTEQAKNLWSLRENISESIQAYQAYKHDVSVQPSQIGDFLKELDELLHKNYPRFQQVIFGHLGDGNLHINILKNKELDRAQFIKICEKAKHAIFTLVQKYQGAISAEHGVGLLKKEGLKYSCSQEEIRCMKHLKSFFDPDHILNPGKIFDI